MTTSPPIADVIRITGERIDPAATEQAPVLPGMPEPPATDEHGQPRGTRYYLVSQERSAIVAVAPDHALTAQLELDGDDTERAWRHAAIELSSSLPDSWWEEDAIDASRRAGPRGGFTT